VFNKNAFGGLFFTSMSALMLEILLTRVFSVATWYYFAFFAISLAMFGFTVGAIIVYLGKNFFTAERLYDRLAIFALLFGISVDLALLIFLSIPFAPRLTGVGVFATAVTYTAISIPFIFAGVVICLCMTRFSDKIGMVYAADLIGAGVGAFLVFPVLNAMDAPSAILLTGALGALGAVCFASDRLSSNRHLKTTAAIIFVVLTASMAVNSLYQPVRVEWVKGQYNTPQVETWNAFSRIAVYPFVLKKMPYSWGISRSYDFKNIIGERMIDIDGVSQTVMTLYDGNPESVKHLKYDVTSIAHYLRKNAKVFIIGVGGGRDILAAKTFGQKEVVGAEINDRTIDMITRVFGDFTGHLDKLPGVRIINDEARSAITRMDEKFDIIQASCIATWSATAAGAFSLAENSLYTVEGWKIFFNHLNPGGVLSFNRWYSPDYPAQLLRLTTLAAYTLKQEGVPDPAKHIMIVRSEGMGQNMPSATILVRKEPFSKSDIKTMEDTVKKLQFKFVFNPAGFQDKLFVDVIKNVGNKDYYASTPLDISPSTDDRPFFFYMLRLKDAVASRGLMKLKEQSFNLMGMVMLFVLAVVSIVLSFLFIFAPLVLAGGRLPGRGALSGFAFFGAIGLGYIFVEMAQLQRLIIFLGHPVYSITVVIFALLFSSGLGAMASGAFTGKGKRPAAGLIAVVMSVLVLLLLLIVFKQTAFLSSFIQSGIHARIALSLLILIPLGFIMGIPFPIGMTIASNNFSGHTAWFWAINGAMSVVASVISVCVSIAWGFTATLEIGLACYVLAGITLILFSKTDRLRKFGS